MRGAPGLTAVAMVVLGVVGASCGSDTSTSTAPTVATPRRSAPSTVSGGITVFAASSLTDSFNQVAVAFMTEHPDTKVTVNFGASSELVSQIGQGAPVDVFASADQANMTKVTDAGEAAAEPVVFAQNSLEIIVEAGNPKKIMGVADLADPDLIVVTCDPAVPIGKYSAQVLTQAGVTVTPKSLEQNVKGIVTKVTAGEADAGIVYTTDVTAAGDKAAGVDIPADINVIATYPIVALQAAPNPKGAQAFIEFVTSPQGQTILATYGFREP